METKVTNEQLNKIRAIVYDAYCEGDTEAEWMLAVIDADLAAEQEPVAWRDKSALPGYPAYEYNRQGIGEPLYTAPAPAPQRETNVVEALRRCLDELKGHNDSPYCYFRDSFNDIMEQAESALGAKNVDRAPHARDAVAWTPETGYVFADAKNANAAPEQEPVAWSHPDFDFAVMGKAPVNPPIEEWTPLVPLGSKSPSPQSQPVARVTGYYGGRCVIEPLDGKSVFPTGMAVYSVPVAAQSAQPDLWDGAEEWERLAFELCAEECGEEACNELIWSDFEPWGERWLMYEDEAKRMIQLVRKHTAPPSRESEQPVSNTGFCIGLPPVSAPPSREWQGLTNEEVVYTTFKTENEYCTPGWCMDFARAIESALKEKNHG